MNHKNLVVICDNHTRFEGVAVATAVKDRVKFNTSITLYSSVDAGSLSDTFLKINNIRDAYVFLCVNADPIFKKIKVSSFVEEVKNLCLNLRSIGCTPIICLNYFQTDNDFRKKKLRHVEKGLIDSCHDHSFGFIRVNLFEKEDYFFLEKGKINLIGSIEKFLLETRKARSDFKRLEMDNGSIRIKRARKVIT